MIGRATRLASRASRCRTSALATAVLTLAVAAPATAATPCDPAKTARLTISVFDRPGDQKLVTSHPIDLNTESDDNDDNASSVDRESVRFASTTPGVTFSNGTRTVVAANAGALEIRADWEQDVIAADGTSERCSAFATRTLTVVQAKPLRVAISGGFDDYGNYVRTKRGFTGALRNLAVGLIAGNDSDFSPVTVRFRARTGAARFPNGPLEQATLAVDRSSERQRLLGRDTPLRLYRELFPFGGRKDGKNEIARITAGPFVLFSTGTGYYQGNGGYEVEVLQRGQRLVRVRATLKKCHKKHGCQTDGRIESAVPLVTYATE